MAREQRRLAAILAADVAGYSRLMAADEAGTLARFNALKAEVIGPKIAEFKGTVVGSAGDSLLIEFPSVVDAVQCAVETQERIAERNAGEPEDRRIVFRMGINLGDVIAEGTTIHGDGVNVASRLEKLAEPGGICIARTVHDHVEGKLPFAFEYLGEQQVKNIAKPVGAYKVATERRAARDAPGSVATGEAARRRQSIAVLPFANLSGDPEQEYFSDGVTEDLITALARHHGLFVIARHSSFVFKGKSVPIPEVGRQLGVRYVVEGSVRKSGKRIRVTAQLIDAEAGAHVWAEKYDRDLEDVFAVQDEIVETVVWRVAGHIAKAEIERAKGRRRENVDAYDLLLQGMSVFEPATRDNAEAAIKIWTRASDLDPTWGRPLSHIATAYMVLGFQDVDSKQFDRGIEAARRALSLTYAEDWTEALIGYIHAKRGDFKTADMHMDRAFAKNPQSPMTLQWHAYSLLWRGDAAGAIAIGLSLRRLDPLDRVWVNDLLGYAYYLAADYESSLESLRRCMPFVWWGDYGYLAACLGQLGHVDEARAAWRKLLEMKPDFTVEKVIATISVNRPEDKEHVRAGLLKAGLA